MRFEEVVEAYKNPPNFRGFFIHDHITHRDLGTGEWTKPCVVCDEASKEISCIVFGGLPLCIGHMKMLNRRIQA